MNKQWLWSISTVILLESWMLVIASFLLLVPWDLLLGFIASKQNISTIGYLRLLIGGGAIVWSVLIFILRQKQKSNSDKFLLIDSILIDLAQFDNMQICIEKLEDFGVYHQTEYRFLASNLTKFINYQDDAEDKLEEALITFKNPSKKSNKPYIVLISQAFWARFKNHPEALSSVLIHEAAHLKNKDLDFFITAKDFILISFWVNLFAFLISLTSSIIVDSTPFSLQVLQASLIGKSYLIFQILPIILLYYTQRELESWREALADREAIFMCGEKALNQAEILLNNPALVNSRPTRKKAKNSLTLNPYWIMLGAFVGTIISSRSGVLSYLQRDLINNIFIQNTLTLLASILLASCLYVSFFYILAVLSRDALDKKLSLLRIVGINSSFFIIGSSLSFFFLEVLPSLVTSSLMPKGFDYIYRVDTDFLSVSYFIIFSLITASNFAVLAIIGAWIAATSRKLWFGLLPGICWVITSQLESQFFPSLMEGKLAYLLTIILISFLIIPSRRYISFKGISRKNCFLLLPLIILIIGGRMGYGDVGHRAASYSQAGVSKIQAGEITEAIYYLQKATEYAPKHPQGWMDLAISLRQTNSSREALEAADKAVFAPFNNSWDEKSKSLVLAGSLRLESRTVEDLEIAKQYYQEVEQMWRQNSRLPSEYVSSTLYNLACIYALVNQDILESTIYLAEAAAIDPTIPHAAINDPDLSILDLSNQQSLSLEEGSKLSNLQVSIAVPNLRGLINEGQLSNEILLRWLKYLAQNQ